MTFLWPASFVALVLIPLLILLYVWTQRRRRRYAVRYSSLSLVRLAMPSQSRLKRYLPMALFFLALASLVVGLARPVIDTQVPAGRATVMLVLDVSGSMNQNDVRPTRLIAAKQAAMGFVDKQKSTNQVGVVAFSDFAQLVQAPTTDPEKLDQAISSLNTGRRTAIGEGIVAALDAIDRFSQSAEGQPTATPTPQEQYRPDIIVLLTDGVSNSGISPLKAAQQAVDQRVRVYTIGYGTQAGGSRQDPGFGGGFGGRGGGFFGRGMGIDEQSLQAIASATGGKYYTATSAGELQSVFDNLPTVLITRQETVEISVVAAALAAMLVIASLLLSQLWHPLP
jgi:Ca-activated chloride channel homolog